MHSLETRTAPTMVSSRRRPVLHLLLAALTAVALTACGDDDSEPGIQGEAPPMVPAPGPAPPPGEADAERSLGAGDAAR